MSNKNSERNVKKFDFFLVANQSKSTTKNTLISKQPPTYGDLIIEDELVANKGIPSFFELMEKPVYNQIEDGTKLNKTWFLK